MALDIGQGPFDVYIDGVVIEGIESVDFTVEEETTDISTIQGQKVTIPKSHSAETVLTFVDTSISNLKKIVPSAWIANGAQVEGQLTGTVVANAEGAIALGAIGSSDAVTAALQIVPATGADEHTVTLFDGVATLSDITIEDQIVKAQVTIRSQATGVQILKGNVTVIS